MTNSSTLPHEQAVSLRAIASWLESRPEAQFQEITRLSEQLFVKRYVTTADAMQSAVESIGGAWRLNTDGLMVRLIQQVTPDVEYVLLASQDNVPPDALAAFERIGRAAA